jgi:hypothetical protein
MRRDARQFQVYFSAAGSFRKQIEQVRTRFIVAPRRCKRPRQMKLKYRIGRIVRQRIAIIRQRQLQLRSLRRFPQQLRRSLVRFALREHRIRQRMHLLVVQPREQRRKRQQHQQHQHA